MKKLSAIIGMSITLSIATLCIWLAALCAQVDHNMVMGVQAGVYGLLFLVCLVPTVGLISYQNTPLDTQDSDR